MMPRARRVLIAIGTVAFSAGCTAVLAVKSQVARPQPPEWTAALAATRSEGRVLAPASKFAGIVERPLFAPTRRPIPKSATVDPVVEAKLPPAPPPVLAAALVGVLISPTGRFAVLRWPDGKNTTVAEGAAVEGWLLKQVMPDRALLISGATSTEVKFSTTRRPDTIAAAAERPVAPTRRRP